MKINAVKITRFTAVLFPVCLALLSGCKRTDPNHPGYELTGDLDMYRSPSYETYAPNPVFGDSMSARKPVAGTVPRGYSVYPYPNTPEGYEAAGKEWMNPMEKSGTNLKEGERLFNVYCSHCHGTTGQGDGKMVQNGKYPPVPSYSNQLKDLPEGKMYHTLMYGKGLMGSHASQLLPEERWKIIMHIQTLQKPAADANAAPAAQDTAKKN